MVFGDDFPLTHILDIVNPHNPIHSILLGLKRMNRRHKLIIVVVLALDQIA